MLGATEIYTALNVASITSLIDTYTNQEGTEYPAIFEDNIIPSDLELSKKTINFYRSTFTDMARDLEQYTYTINCRAGTYKESDAIADAVITVLNRVGTSSVFTTCKLMTVIPPFDVRDNYNTPIECIIKMK
jgi:hypothetical protein